MIRKIIIERIVVIFLTFSIALPLIGCGGKQQPVTKNTLPEGSTVETLFTLEKAENMSVSMTFDKELPDIAFINPQDEMILSATLNSNTGDTWAEYFLPEAEVGKWQAVYMKGKNTKVKFSCESYVYEVGISNFVPSPAGNSAMPITFTVSSATKGTCIYKVTALASDDKNALEILLKEDVAKLNKETSESISIKRLPDGTILPDGGYKIKLTVSLEYDGELVTDSKIADSYILTVKHSIETEETTDETAKVTTKTGGT